MRKTYLVLAGLLVCASGFGQELCRFNVAGKQGFRDEANQVIVPAKYDEAEDFSEGLAIVKLKGKWGFIDKTGKEVIPLKYDNVEGFSDGLARVWLEQKSFYIDKTGNEVIQLVYDYAGNFSEGLAYIKKGGKWGYIDKTGKEVIQPVYDYAGDFSEGLAWIKIRDKYGVSKYGYIDKTGKEVILPKYDKAEDFSDGLARVWLEQKSFYIDKTGAVTTYTSPKMKIIWENLLESCIKYINDYRTPLNKSSVSSGFFEINRPYLVVSTQKGEHEDMNFVSYSGCNFNKNALDGLKTIIVEYNYLEDWASYTVNQEKVKVESYGSYLVYFDMEKKECIGYDVMHGPYLPPQLPTFNGFLQRWRGVKFEDIIERIESHLKDSPATLNKIE